MKVNFETGFKILMNVEGGYCDDKNDCGGKTKYGISQKAYPNLVIVDLTIAKAKEIYKRDYWDKCRCDDLPPSLDIAVFCAAVNMGVPVASSLLQQTLGVSADGKIGNQTISAAKKADEVVLRNYFIYCMYHYSQCKTYQHHGKGWRNRLLTVSGAI